jgi:hypothetical protein
VNFSAFPVKVRLSFAISTNVPQVVPIVGAGGAMHIISVEEINSTTRVLTKPNLQTRSFDATKWIPKTVTTVPPSSGPWVGEIAVTEADARNLNCLPLEEKSTPLLETSNTTLEGTCRGQLQRISLVECQIARTTTSPNLQDRSRLFVKFSPSTKMIEPPEAGALFGIMFVT